MNLPTKSRVVAKPSGYRPRLRLCAIVVMAICLSTAKEASADWVFERGDARASGVADTELPAKPQQLWRFTAEESGFEATAVIAAGKVYLGDVDGTFYALQLSDGSLIWEKQFEDCGFLSAAAIVEGRLYVGDYNGVVRCLDAANGDELWMHEARGESYAGPNVVAGRVLVTTEAGELLSLVPESGQVQWRFEIEAPLRCWPTSVEGRVLLAGCDSRLYAVDLETGKETGGVDLGSQTGATPARWDDSVFFGTASGTFYRIKGNEIVWEYRDEDHLQQTFSAAVDQRAVIYGSKGKRVYSLDPESGNPQWQFPVHSAVESAPVIAGEAVFFATKRGRLYGVDIKSGQQRWQFEAGGRFIASPAVSDGRLILGNTDGSLYCFGKKGNHE
jgi:outer membrane protein assembly factor BamB